LSFPANALRPATPPKPWKCCRPSWNRARLPNGSRAGWDDDPRETAEIPEIRAWFADLTAEFSYWLHFIEKEGDTLFHVLRLLCAGHIEQIEQGMIGWRFDDKKQLSATVETLFGYTNGLYRQLGLPEEMRRRVTEEVGQLIEGALG
jgi:hypothetical protein